jgi:hypothetical protein
MIPEIRAASSVLPSHTGGNRRSSRSNPAASVSARRGRHPRRTGPNGVSIRDHCATKGSFRYHPGRGGSIGSLWYPGHPSLARFVEGPPRWLLPGARRFELRLPCSAGARPASAGGASRSHRRARGSARASADVPRRGARAQRGRRPPPLRRARVRALPGLRNPGAWLRPGPVRRVQARIPGGILVQEPRSLRLATCSRAAPWRSRCGPSSPITGAWNERDAAARRGSHCRDWSPFWTARRLVED